MSLAKSIKDGASIGEIEAALDAMDSATRLAELRAVDGKGQKRLFELAAGRPTTLADFVPAGKAPLQEVIHEGRNSLPLFTLFQKRFCLPSQPDGSNLLGYNEQAMRFVTGPGYFVVREDVAPGTDVRTVVIDYTLEPKEKAQAWPPIRPNTAGLSRLVYANMQDWMWRVSKDVTIGRARKAGWENNWFWLCRQGG